MNHPYTQAEYDAFGWSPLGVSGETYGLDYESAREATPRLYGVSYGDGNNGVSHIFANYYVRTADPWLLVQAATIGGFQPDYYQQACDEMEIDGEPDYTLTGTILDPFDDDADDSFYTDAASGELIEMADGCWRIEGRDEETDYDSKAAAARAYCEANDIYPAPYSEVNGAWFICEVFPEDEPRSGLQPCYGSIEEAFSADLIAIAQE